MKGRMYWPQIMTQVFWVKTDMFLPLFHHSLACCGGEDVPEAAFLIWIFASAGAIIVAASPFGFQMLLAWAASAQHLRSGRW